MLYPPGFYFVKKSKRFVISSSNKSSERNLSSFFDIEKPRRIEHLQTEEPFSSDPYFSSNTHWSFYLGFYKIKEIVGNKYFERITHRGSRHQGMCPQKSHQSFSVTKQDVENQDKVVVAKYLINNLWNWGQWLEV